MELTAKEGRRAMDAHGGCRDLRGKLQAVPCFSRSDVFRFAQLALFEHSLSPLSQPNLFPGRSISTGPSGVGYS